jgi:ATP-dependent DNA ligase
MVKVKPVLETMDLVVVAAEWGEGKRSGWLTSLHRGLQGR